MLAADFIGTPVSGVAPLTVAFTDLSTGSGISTWRWEFGDGNYDSSQNPTYTYARSGILDVSLRVSAQGESDTVTKTGYISITETPTLPFSQFIRQVDNRFVGDPHRDIDVMAVKTVIEMSRGINYSPTNTELGQVKQAITLVSGIVGPIVSEFRQAWLDYKTRVGAGGSPTAINYYDLIRNMYRDFDGRIEYHNDIFVDALFLNMRDITGFTGSELDQINRAITQMNRYGTFLLDLQAALAQYQTDLGG